MVFTFKFVDESIVTYEFVEEIHKDGKIYKAPFNDIPILFSGKYIFVHKDGHQSFVNGDLIREMLIG